MFSFVFKKGKKKDKLSKHLFVVMVMLIIVRVGWRGYAADI